jgi:hypothetical protein
VPAKLIDIAVSEEKKRALNIVAASLAVDRWNYIINGACFTAKPDGPPARPEVGCLRLSCHARR